MTIDNERGERLQRGNREGGRKHSSLRHRSTKMKRSVRQLEEEKLEGTCRRYLYSALERSGPSSSIYARVLDGRLEEAEEEGSGRGTNYRHSQIWGKISLRRSSFFAFSHLLYHSRLVRFEGVAYIAFVSFSSSLFPPLSLIILGREIILIAHFSVFASRSAFSERFADGLLQLLERIRQRYETEK